MNSPLSGTTRSYSSGAAEANGLTVTNPSANEYVFTDTFPIPVIDGDLGDAECAQTAFSQVTCNLTSPASFITVNLNDLGDTANRSDVAPVWWLGVAMGMGGAAGSYLGIRIQHRLPELFLRRLLGLLAAAIGCSYAVALL